VKLAHREGDSVVLVEVFAAGAVAYMVREHLTTPFDPLFDRIGREFDVPPNLLRAIARVESSFNPKAVNSTTLDYGLMQINKVTASRYGITDTNELFDPEKCVRLAARILSDMRRNLRVSGRFSSITWAIAYNVGPDLSPWHVGSVYGQRVVWNWTLYDLGRTLA